MFLRIKEGVFMFFKEIKEYKEIIRSYFSTIDVLDDISTFSAVREDISLMGKIERWKSFAEQDILNFDDVIRSSKPARYLYVFIFFGMCALNAMSNVNVFSFILGIVIISITKSLVSWKIEMDVDTRHSITLNEFANKYPDAPCDVAGLYNAYSDITSILKELHTKNVIMFEKADALKKIIDDFKDEKKG